MGVWIEFSDAVIGFPAGVVINELAVGADDGCPLKTAGSDMLRKDSPENRLSREGRIRGDEKPLLSGLVGRDDSKPLSIRSKMEELL
jgi:hypothetical protein